MKRKIALVLSLILLFTLITACTKPGDSGATDTTSNPPASTSTGSNSGNASTGNGNTATSPDNPSPESVSIVYEVTLYGMQNPEAEYTKRIAAAINDAIGIDIQLTGETNAATTWDKPNMMLVAGEPLDVFRVDTMREGEYSWKYYVDQDLIIPLNDLLDKYGQNLKKNIMPESWKFCTDDDGNIWGLPYEVELQPMILYVRQDWLDALNMSVPKTMAEYEAVFQAFKDKYNDVGFIPLWEYAEEQMLLGSFVKCPDVSQPYIDANGHMQPYWTQPGYTDFLSKMAEWYQKGYLFREFSTVDYGTALEMYAAGQSGIMMNYGCALKSRAAAIGPDARLSPCTPMDFGAVAAQLPVAAFTLITSQSKNPEAVMKWLDFQAGTKEGWLLCNFGIEGVDYTILDAATGLISLEQQTVDYGSLFSPVKPNALNRAYLTDVTEADVFNYYQDQSRYPSYVAETLGFSFDNEKLLPFKDKLAGLDVERNELRVKIIMGEATLSDWADFTARYMAGGGTGLYAEMERQWNSR